MAAKSVCTIPGCGKSVVARGWCSAHYARWRNHGSPEGGLHRPDVERYYQEIVLRHEGPECLLWPYARNTQGYGIMHARDGVITKAVHRRLCTEIVGPPPSPKHEAAHSCGNGHLGCVAKKHLSWKTKSENQMDRVEHGTHARGGRCWRAAITEETVRKIRAMQATHSQRATARLLGLNRKTVEHVLSKHTWGWLD